MKKYLLFLILLPFFGFAQQTPEFSFELYFEDAAGNRDTIILGYDPLSTDSIDNLFGEVNILDQPWKDGIDVRISPIWNPAGLPTPDFYTKTQIVPYECLFYYPKVNQINIKTKNWPVTVSNAFFAEQDSCNEYTLLTSIQPGGWWDVGGYSDLDVVFLAGGTYNKVFTPNYAGYYSEADLGNHHTGFFTEEGDTVNIFWQGFILEDNFYSNIIESEKALIDIAPNPFENQFYISADYEVKNIKIVNLQGKEIAFEKEKNMIRPLNCGAGIYFLSFQVNGKRYNHKIVKQ